MIDELERVKAKATSKNPPSGNWGRVFNESRNYEPEIVKSQLVLRA
jgi:hypothetical protein